MKLIGLSVFEKQDFARFYCVAEVWLLGVGVSVGRSSGVWRLYYSIQWPWYDRYGMLGR